MGAGCAPSAPRERLAQERPTETLAPLFYELEGPLDDPVAAMNARIRVDEDCAYETYEEGAKAIESGLVPYEENPPLIDAVLMHYPSDVACGPATMCSFAIQTEKGWWVPPIEHDVMCEGPIGTGVDGVLLAESIDLDDVGAQVNVTRLRASRFRHPKDMEPVRLNLAGSHTFGCTLRSDGVPVCQRIFGAVNWDPFELDELGLECAEPDCDAHDYE